MHRKKEKNRGLNTNVFADAQNAFRIPVGKITRKFR